MAKSSKLRHYPPSVSSSDDGAPASDDVRELRELSAVLAVDGVPEATRKEIEAAMNLIVARIKSRYA